jgi:ketosteroid isomerase-like protein
MRYILTVAFLVSGLGSLRAQHSDRDQILAILERQTQAWNQGDLDHFMVGYWNNDSLMYIGKGGVTYGYRQTLQTYKKNYRDNAYMGKLQFTILHVNPLSPQAYLVIGKWHLTRSVGDSGGHFSLVFRKIKGEWVIVADHSS